MQNGIRTHRKWLQPFWMHYTVTPQSLQIERESVFNTTTFLGQIHFPTAFTIAAPARSEYYKQA